MSPDARPGGVLAGARAELVERLADGPGGAFLHGLWGSGRSTVMAALAARLEERGETVLQVGQGFEPLEPLDGLFERLGRPREDLDAALRAGGPEPAAELLRSLLPSSTALLVDELERLDGTSREVLEALGRLVEPPGARWFMAVEPLMVDPSRLRRRPAGGAAPAAARLFALPGLDEETLHGFVRGLPRERAEWVLGASEGHAVQARLYAAWARRAASEAELPETPARAAAEILDSLSAEAQEAAGLLGLVGRVPARLLPSGPVEELVEAGLALAERGAVRPSGPAAARAMALRPGARVEVVEGVSPTLRARFLEAAGEPSRELHQEILRQAVRRGALATARELHRPGDPEEVLEPPATRPGARLLARARERFQAGNAAEAGALLREVAALGDPYLDVERLILEESVTSWERGAELARHLGLAEPESEFLDRLARWHMSLGEWERARPHLERLVELPRDPEILARLQSGMELLAGTCVALRDFAAAERAYESLLELGVPPERVARTCVELGRLALLRGSVEEAHARFRRALADALPEGRSLALAGLAEAALVEGRHQEARRLAEEARALPSADPWVEVATGRLMVEAALQALDLQRALELVEETLPLAEQRGFADEAERLAGLQAVLRSRAGGFRVERGPLRGKVFPVPPRDTRVGRSDECGVTLPDRSVSREHAAVEWSQGRPYLVALNPHNVTELNGSPVIVPTALAPGDRVRLGDLVLIWEEG